MNRKVFPVHLAQSPVNKSYEWSGSLSTSQLSNLLGFYGELEIQPFQKFKELKIPIDFAGPWLSASCAKQVESPLQGLGFIDRSLGWFHEVHIPSFSSAWPKSTETMHWCPWIQWPGDDCLH